MSLARGYVEAKSSGAQVSTLSGMLHHRLSTFFSSLHQAALRSVPRSVDNPTATNDVNIGGTLNVLHASKEAGVKRVVSASSSSVSGEREDFPLREEMETDPLLTCKVFTKLYGLETVSMRYFNVFGPRMAPNLACAAFIAIFAAGMLEGRPLR